MLIKYTKIRYRIERGRDLELTYEFNVQASNNITVIITHYLSLHVVCPTACPLCVAAHWSSIAIAPLPVMNAITGRHEICHRSIEYAVTTQCDHHRQAGQCTTSDRTSDIIVHANTNDTPTHTLHLDQIFYKILSDNVMNLQPADVRSSKPRSPTQAYHWSLPAPYMSSSAMTHQMTII